MTARAFAAYAYAEGDWETCDALLAEGGAAAGGIFTALAERQLWTRVPIATVAPPHSGPTY
jgi:hypothetical protein